MTVPIMASSLELIYAQVATLTTRIDSVQIKAELLRSSVALIRALGGGWNRNQLPNDEQIQPFNTFQYTNLDKPLPAGGINVNAENNWVHNDLTAPTAPRASAEGKTGNTRSGRDQGESSADRSRSREPPADDKENRIRNQDGPYDGRKDQDPSSHR